MIDGERTGRVVRAVRQRLRLRQVDVGMRAGVSAAAVSRIERGRLNEVGVSSVGRVAGALDIRLELVARWRGGDLDRMLNAKHAALAEDVVSWLLAHQGWEVRPEVSFSVYGERGVIDILAWNAGTRALLVVELKTEIVDVGELLGTFDRKRRLAAGVARDLDWTPTIVGAALLVRATRTNHRRVAAHARTLRAALPDDSWRLNAWLRAPSGPLAALAFVPDRQPAAARHVRATNRRVRLEQMRPFEPSANVPQRRSAANNGSRQGVERPGAA